MELESAKEIIESLVILVVIPLLVQAGIWLRGKAKLDKVISDSEIESAITGVVDRVIGIVEMHSENGADNGAGKMPSSEKLSRGIQLAESELTESPNLPTLHKSEIELRIEGRLGNPEAPGGITK